MGRRFSEVRNLLILLPLFAGLTACGSSTPPPQESKTVAEAAAPPIAELGAPTPDAPAEPDAEPAPSIEPKAETKVQDLRQPSAPAPMVAKPSRKNQKIVAAAGEPAPVGEEPVVAPRTVPTEKPVAAPSRQVQESTAPASPVSSPSPEVPSPSQPGGDTDVQSPVPPADTSQSFPAADSRRPELVIPPPPPFPGAAPDGSPSAAAPMKQPVESEPVTDIVIPEGTVIEVRLTERLTSATNRSGDQFQTILDRDIENDRGDVILPKGTTVGGSIVSVAEPGRVKGRASLTFKLDRIDFEHVDRSIITNEITIEAESGTGDDAKKVGVGAAVGAALGAIFGGKRGAVMGGAAGAGSSTAQVLLSKGKQVVVEPERLFSFRLEQDLFLPGHAARDAGASASAP